LVYGVADIISSFAAAFVLAKTSAMLIVISSTLEAFGDRQTELRRRADADLHPQAA